LILFFLAIVGGYGSVLIRKWKTGRRILKILGFSGPEPNIYQAVMKVDHKFALNTVALKDGRIFAGFMTQQQTDDSTENKALYFSRLRWPEKKSKSGWGKETDRAMLVPLESINFIELGAPPKTENRRQRMKKWLAEFMLKQCADEDD